MNIRRYMRKLKYYFSKNKEVIYDDCILNYHITDDMFNDNATITLIRYNPDRDSITVLFNKVQSLKKDM